jgi:hypothetical protein
MQLMLDLKWEIQNGAGQDAEIYERNSKIETRKSPITNRQSTIINRQSTISLPLTPATLLR